ncbi:Protein BolA homolog [Candidatus Terasakiella magnetica]|uniref:Protein BolA homolog n=1 Tax=Candidatus Terasakiella magnetica TaxID=1867952 RepID=A0A1C3RL08_9PROT|nr:BolA family protein [Candidatus Terasakiella magnetica]SCA57938.1 Protein BolA homolog [Candidatus Terasakiella magnetica]
MSVAEKMEEKLKKALKPQFLKLEDESFRHAGHAGANPQGESHFQLLIVSSAFENVSRVQRQRMVYDVLADEMQGRVHALALKTLTPNEYKNTE